MLALKKSFAAAIALALPFAAMAQAPAEAKPAEAKPLVTIYGTLNVNFQYSEAVGATAAASDVKGRYGVSVDSSNIGVRGAYDVNEYVGAVYQCETSAVVDGITPSGICNRNSRLGISGVWGTLFFGNWDTPFKAAAYGTKADDPFLNTDVFGFNGLMSSPGFNYRSGAYSTASNTATTGFDIRAQNSVAYHSPKFNGLSAKLQYSADEFKNARGNQDPALYGAVVNWDYGPISVLAAAEYHQDGWGLFGMNGAAGTFGSTAPNTQGTAAAPVSAKDIAWRVGAGYELAWPAGATTLGVLFEELDYQSTHQPVGALKEYKRDAYQVSLKHRYGDHEFRARWNMADKGTVTLEGGGGNTADYGASELALGYAYYFAKSFQGYLSWAQITNAKNAQYTFPIGGASAVAGATPKGADPMALGLGLRYAF